MPDTFTRLNALNVSGNAAFAEGMNNAEVAGIAEAISTEFKMSTPIESLPIASTIGQMREWKGSRQEITQGFVGDIELAARTFEKTVRARVIDVDHGLIGKYIPTFRNVGRAAGQWKYSQLIAKINAGATDLCYDGQAMFSDSHPIAPGSSTTFDNLLGSGAAPWYVVSTRGAASAMVFGMLRAPVLDPKWSEAKYFDEDVYVWGVKAYGVAAYGLPHTMIKHSGTLDASNFEAACAALRSMVNDGGENMGLDGDLILVPPAHAMTAAKLFGRQNLGSDGDNIHNGRKWMVCPGLTNA